jgi:hypothetical protein
MRTRLQQNRRGLDSMKIAFISDIHGNASALEYPNSEVMLKVIRDARW